jgi:3-oxoacyl-[acyl-carrier protein] reductase
MNKVAIVTGAANGIGAATAKLLAKHGITVGVLDINEQGARDIANEINKENGKAIAIKCDVGKSSDVIEAIGQIESAIGTPLILVNNAGVGGPFHKVHEVSEEEWDWIINTNLKSVFLFSRNLLPKMKDANYGRIVNIASIQGLYGSAHSSTYVASKHGMIGYTKTIAAEWGQFGIACNAVCPGYVETALGVQEDKVSDYMKKVMEKSPVKRIAAPEEVADLIYFLTEQNKGYINGASYTIDGGITSHVGITSAID